MALCASFSKLSFWEIAFDHDRGLVAVGPFGAAFLAAVLIAAR